ncbi:MAG: outer membrane beta-barrel protein [Saprospiraceae bacterium]|nr:outer membrane beta-barrel protein [Saprospiraceae bacterium]
MWPHTINTNTLKIMIFLQLAAFSLYGQLYYGVKLGLSPSTYSITESINYKTSPSYLNLIGGVSVEYPIIYGLSVQADVQYARRKAHFNSNFDRSAIAGGTFYSDFLTDLDETSNNNGQSEQNERFTLPDLYDNYTLSVGYLENHIMVKYEFMGGDKGFYIQAGPYFGIGLSANMSKKFSDKSGSQESTTGVLVRSDGKKTNNYNSLLSSYDKNGSLKLDTNPFEERSALFDMTKLDVGLALGGGMYKELGSGRMYFDGRFLLGTSNLFKNDDFNKLRSLAFQLSVMYRFTME